MHGASFGTAPRHAIRPPSAGPRKIGPRHAGQCSQNRAAGPTPRMPARIGRRPAVGGRLRARPPGGPYSRPRIPGQNARMPRGAPKSMPRPCFSRRPAGSLEAGIRRGRPLRGGRGVPAPPAGGAGAGKDVLKRRGPNATRPACSLRLPLSADLRQNWRGPNATRPTCSLRLPLSADLRQNWRGPNATRPACSPRSRPVWTRASSRR